MVSVDPVKTVGICFFDTGCQAEYLIKADDYRSIDTLADFLIESKAVIISLENFSDAETRVLRERDKTRNGTIFASPDCFGHHCLKRGYVCARACALKRQRRC